jgi:3-oxoacyl-[acyl-carrier protein] reductase
LIVDLGLDGKIAWVIGGSSGLGKASALALAAEGARVAISARDEGALEKAVEEIRATTKAECVSVQLDVSDGDAIEAAAERVAASLGSVDVLVANAGGPPPGPFAAFDDDALFDAFTLTAASAWRLTKQVAHAMQARKSGCVIYVTSSSTKEVIPGLLLSNMMRASVVGMMKTLSKELGPDGVRALCVSPGRIFTPRVAALDSHRAAADDKDPAEVRAESESAIPLRRYGEPREFGEVVAFLASERASYVTGVNVVVDGGALNGVTS